MDFAGDDDGKEYILDNMIKCVIIINYDNFIFEKG